jgi:hypothetical protein
MHIALLTGMILRARRSSKMRVNISIVSASFPAITVARFIGRPSATGRSK